MAEEKKREQWLHRITGGPNATKLSHPLLFKHNILSTGWSELSYDEFVECGRKDSRYFDETFAESYPTLKNRNMLKRFLMMKKGDWVVVPTWGVFSICEILDDNIYTTESLEKIISIKDLIDWDGNSTHFDDKNYLCDINNDIVDLGFFRTVKLLTPKLPRQEYADDRLFSRMKILQTNANISDLEKSILRAESLKPILIHDELLKATLESAKRAITTFVQHHAYEKLVEKYLKAIGADDVIKPAPNESKTSEGDADRVAYFENLKTAVMVQVKKHNHQTGKWAVEQIKAYKDNHLHAEYNIQMWIISNAEDFTYEAKQEAHENNVRLINGEDFARMILEVGLKHFE